MNTKKLIRIIERDRGIRINMEEYTRETGMQPPSELHEATEETIEFLSWLTNYINEERLSLCQLKINSRLGRRPILKSR